MHVHVQVAFVGHDAGHNAVAHSSKYDGYIGLLVNACIGIGPSWWKVSFCATGTLVVLLALSFVHLTVYACESVAMCSVTKLFCDLLIKCMSRRS